MQRIKAVFFIMCTFMSFVLFSQTFEKPQFMFKDLYSEKELGFTGDIIQDHQGNIWLAEDGLVKFDGIDSKLFTKNEHSNSLLIDNIYTLFLDSKGYIWLGYKGAGVSRFDPKTERFLHFPADKNLKSKAIETEKKFFANIIDEDKQVRFPKDQISAFTEDKQGNIWVATSAGLYKATSYGGKSYQLTTFEHTTESDKYVFSVVIDDKQNLWMGTAVGLFYSELKKTKKIELKQVMLIPNKETSQVVYVSKVQKDKLWVSTISSGIFQVDLNTLEVLPLFENQLNWSITLTYKIIEAKNGDVWLATSNGLGFIDHRNGQLVFYQNSSEDINSLKIDSVFDVFIDKQNELWIVTEVGVQKLNVESAFFKTMFISKIKNGYLKEKDISSVFADSENNLWFSGASTGLYRQKMVPSEFLVSFQQISSSIFYLPTPDVLSFFEDSQGRYWVGTRYNGVYKISKIQTHYKELLIDEYGLQAGNWNDVFFEDNDGQIWLANISGLFVYNEIKDKFVQAHFSSVSILKDEQPTINKLHQLDYYLLAGSSEGDIFYSNKDSLVFEKIKIIDINGKTVELLDIRAMVSIQNELWIASRKGLFRAIFQSKLTNDSPAPMILIMDNWNVGQGLIDEDIFNLFSDQYNPNILWFNHNKGVSTFNIKEQSFYHFPELSSYSAKDFDPSCGFQHKQGRIYLCGVDGVLSFNTKAYIEPKKIAPVITLTQLYINNEKVEVNTKNSVITSSINHTSEITLNDQQRNLAFDFAILDYTNPLKNKYAYMLDGFDENWITTTAKRRHANYSNIPTGHYIFRVKGSNSQGVWSEQDAQIKITVLPTWYLTWWAKLLWVLLCIFLFTIIIKSRTRKLQQHSIELERAVEQRTEELKQAQKTIVTQEKMSSLGTLSAGIAHEINNPTNFVYGSCQNMEADLVVFKQFLTDLAGDDADEEVLSAFEQHFKPLFEHLGIIREGAQRIKEIVTGLGVFSRIDLDEMELTSIKQCIETTVQLVNTEYKEVTEFDLCFKDNPEVLCFPSKINQVLMNLLVNAAQAIKQVRNKHEDFFGKVKITTSVTQDQCLISIEDNGTGISEENISKIFEPFFTTKNVGEGTGLGLALSYEIIQQHHGELYVESGIGLGTTFKLILPIEQVIIKEGN